jgi:alpha-L-fucosidase
VPQQPSNKQAFLPADSSLRHYTYPAWFRDAKFGIWAHWGPQAVPRQGD